MKWIEITFTEHEGKNIKSIREIESESSDCRPFFSRNFFCHQFTVGQKK